MLARIKICGITRLQDARLASELGAWAIGFVFAKKSTRTIAPEIAGEILEKLGESAVIPIGVFVDSPADDICRAVDLSRIGGVQLHGSEPPELCAELKKRKPGLLVIKAFRPRSEPDLRALESFSACDQLLVDAFHPSLLGGTGKQADWALATQAKKHGSVILAGGLHAGNIVEAFESVKPFAVDLSSGVEESPGIKSAEKLKQVFESARVVELEAH